MEHFSQREQSQRKAHSSMGKGNLKQNLAEDQPRYWDELLDCPGCKKRAGASGGEEKFHLGGWRKHLAPSEKQRGRKTGPCQKCTLVQQSNYKAVSNPSPPSPGQYLALVKHGIN